MKVNSRTNQDLFRIQYLILPGIYIGAVFFTTALSVNTSGGAYYRILSLCPPVGILGMAIDSDVAIVIAFLLLGTPWWYLVGRIGWDAQKRGPSFLRPTVGALIALLTCFVSTAMTLDPLKQDIHDGVLRTGAVSQYALVVLLCIGALLSVSLAIVAAISSGKRP